eukprot:CAMPEP_0182594138 /NCGR_PEP_ID=MMETSP1324-20130603/79525_1 /TAXON_ID=236786 /ORGANISM="Florenciella sp., Strain RCC1587" /LENGTH=155 /DNA_ID=CAMNT_0024811655 /DNA_START=62 /DNA_END=527 /DNA_ORIENTATION=-
MLTMMLGMVTAATAFVPLMPRTSLTAAQRKHTVLQDFKDEWGNSRNEGYQSRAKYEEERAKKMGLEPGEEYDLERALDANMDDTIVKILAVSFIVPLLGGLAYAFRRSGEQFDPAGPAPRLAECRPRKLPGPLREGGEEGSTDGSPSLLVLVAAG